MWLLNSADTMTAYFLDRIKFQEKKNQSSIHKNTPIGLDETPICFLGKSIEIVYNN